MLHQEYSSIFILLIFSIILAIVILAASYFIGVQNPYPDKLSTYECGFDPYEDARNTVDIHFYLVSILFIIFDLEAMFLFPWAVSLSATGSVGFWCMIDFMLELVIGYVYAWAVGALEWK